MYFYNIVLDNGDWEGPMCEDELAHMEKWASKDLDRMFMEGCEDAVKNGRKDMDLLIDVAIKGLIREARKLMNPKDPFVMWSNKAMSKERTLENITNARDYWFNELTNPEKVELSYDEFHHATQYMIRVFGFQRIGWTANLVKESEYLGTRPSLV
jgi:hypothetical protein